MMSTPRKAQPFTFTRSGPSNTHGDPSNSHGDQVLSRLHAMQKDSHLTDFSLKLSDGGQVQCHKLVLVTTSPFFEALFSTGLTECVADEVDLSYLEPDSVVTLLNYLYSGSMRYTLYIKDILMISL
jgi:hypothetical protein